MGKAYLNELETIRSLHYKKTLDLYVPMVYQQMSGSVLVLHHSLNAKHTLTFSSLPPMFADYSQTLTKLSHTGLCELDLDVSAAIQPDLDCSKVLGGNMALSLPQASEQLDIMLQAASKLTLKEFTEKRTENGLLFVEMNYAYERIKSLFQKMKSEYELAYARSMQNKNHVQNTIYPMYAGLMVGSILLVGVVWFRRKMHRRGEVGIRYFKLLPTKFLLQEHIMEKIKSQGILDRIQGL